MPAPLQVGTLLIASLDLEDANFRRTVVLVIQHSAKEGSIGLVLNRPLGDKVSLYSSEELQRLTGTEAAVKDASAEFGGLFFQGGPVEPGFLFFLHRLDGLIEGGTQVCQGIFLGGDLDPVRSEAAVLESADPVLRFYLGYAGWKKEQLEEETSIGAWLLCPARAPLIFDSAPEELWQRALYSLGGKYRSMSVIPEDPDVN
ncbi:MAG: YqgE/AlgH family protein [Gemmatimonadetes bacterium]|nr:YqgE/AlgH family protein [Gemmatimonadota bacterium]